MSSPAPSPSSLAAILATLVLCLMNITPIHGQVPGCQGRMDLVLVVDSSESVMEHDPFGMPGYHWNMMKGFLTRVLDALPMEAGDTKVALLTYSSVVRPRFGLNTFSPLGVHMQNEVAGLVPERGYTDTTEALKYTAQHMFQGDRPDARNVVVLLSDGLSNKQNADTQLYASNLRRLRQAEFYTVAVTPYVDEVELRNMATSDRHYLMLNLEDMDASVLNITTRLCNASLVPPTLRPPLCELKTDLVLIADNSGSIQEENFPVLQQFLVSLVDSLVIGPDNSRVGLVRFSEFAYVEFDLDDYRTKPDVTDAIWRMAYDGAATNTAAGIRKARQEVFVNQRGDRPSVRNVAIVITDGQSNVDQEQTSNEAELARDAGVIFFVVGITDEIDENELQSIASDPVEDHYFNSTDLRHLDLITDELARLVCYSNYEYFYTSDQEPGSQNPYNSNYNGRRRRQAQGSSASFVHPRENLVLVIITTVVVTTSGLFRY